MKTKLTAIISAIAVTLLALIIPSTVMAQRTGGGYEQSAKKPSGGTTPSNLSQDAKRSGGAIKATPITPDEAAKKYPAPKGGYPTGERDPHKPSGVVSSPYPPRTEFDCSEVAHGGLVLDTHVKKVFVRP